MFSSKARRPSSIEWAVLEAEAACIWSAWNHRNWFKMNILLEDKTMRSATDHRLIQQRQKWGIGLMLGLWHCGTMTGWTQMELQSSNTGIKNTALPKQERHTCKKQWQLIIIYSMFLRRITALFYPPSSHLTVCYTVSISCSKEQSLK